MKISMNLFQEKSGAQPEMQKRPLRLSTLPVLGAVLILTAMAASITHSARAQNTLPGNMTPEVKCVIGLENIKPGTTGTLTFLPSGLQFTTEKEKADISVASITDIFTGDESRQDISGMSGTVVKAAIPYGGGRVLSLFSHKVEVLTIEYTDANGGFRGAIFVLGAGKATELKDKLVAEGAKTKDHVAPAPPPEGADQKEPK
jgi:hypothetical protein